ncbi:MAG: nucleotide exchange factor GrpE [Gammaproteobacteria bacterium]|nr:nucleotide exchange factor GrpE [Gammaproteobacteria bacterium]
MQENDDLPPEQGGTRENPRTADPAADAFAAPEQDALAAAEAKAGDNWNRYLRAVAELDNYRKRASRDVENAHRYANEKFAREMLNVKDSLEMGLEAAANADVQTLLEGKAATLKLLAAALERFGITEIDSEGEPFDPELHEAMATQESAEAEPDSVLTVVQKGYRINGRLLRPARVIVARAAERTEP